MKYVFTAAAGGAAAAHTTEPQNDVKEDGARGNLAGRVARGVNTRYSFI